MDNLSGKKIFLICDPETKAHPGFLFLIDYVFAQRLNLEYQAVHVDEPAENQILIRYLRDLASHENTISVYNSGYFSESNKTVNPASFVAEKPDNNIWKTDVFAAIFKALSREEEFGNFKPDQHGRFDIEAAEYAGYEAYVDRWIEQIRKQINGLAGFEMSPKPSYKYQLTIDIDQVFSYRCKGLERNIKGGTRQLLRGDFSGFIKRKLTVLGLANDPFDMYAWLKAFCQSHQINPIIFIHAGDAGPYDKQVNLQCTDAQEAIRYMSTFAEIGLHSSYQAADSLSMLLLEKQRLEEILGTEVTKSRFHYLKMRLPQSYEMLIEAGFSDDYTMGYASKPGFRAGTSHPFPYFNLEKNEVRPLTIHPFQVMDTTFIRYLPMTPNEAIEYTRNIAKEISELGGILTLLVHNEMQAGQDAWKGWSTTYEKLLKAGLLA